ncbi:hypothetical protein J2S90_000050 [Arthrobacter bambusae]|uniref:Uncharacterized protein n=2 Tax=Arthrobacter bambusae TaxID=1338426 RepID=A0AAW8D5X7_9MICC|nr:hypothetical protein [Arthrobacter bambusae]MDP9903110.1 hypothetical protein [Arthrobacter bambusae]MDQ0180237.1 hypothetical protein [Arthrobacter bambusae]
MLVLAADYLEPSLRDELTGSADVIQWGLPANLIDEIVSWNADYRKIIPLDVDGRHSFAGIIDALDRKGLELAQRIGTELGGSTKVRYYSEGWLRPLEG